MLIKDKSIVPGAEGVSSDLAVLVKGKAEPVVYTEYYSVKPLENNNYNLHYLDIDGKRYYKLVQFPEKSVMKLTKVLPLLKRVKYLHFELDVPAYTNYIAVDKHGELMVFENQPFDVRGFGWDNDTGGNSETIGTVELNGVPYSSTLEYVGE